MNPAAAETMLISPPDNRPDFQKGFSLLEMLVVLAIMGIILSLVSVNMISTIGSTRFVRTAESAVADIKLLRLQAMLEARPVKIVGTQNIDLQTNNNDFDIRRLNLPESWIVSGDEITISSTGFCTGGRISIVDDTDRNIEFTLSAPKCSAKRIN